MSESTPSCACDVLIIGGGPAGSTGATLLAGDIFGKTPIWRSLTAWRRRRINIRPVDEGVQDGDGQV